MQVRELRELREPRNPSVSFCFLANMALDIHAAVAVAVS